MQLVECVPNISEGRDLDVIEQITASVTSVKNAYLLHTDTGYDVNRSVLTIAGEPSAVCDAAFRVIAKTSELIDMRVHKGSHPRIGATDVCPLIPLGNITMSQCIHLSVSLAKRVGDELDIPVYLYGESARSPERKSLAYIRSGEYEKLFLRIDELIFKPDFGPVICNMRSGATAIGARKILIAYNIILDTDNLAIAKAIAKQIRDRCDEHYPSHVSQSPSWEHTQAIGWYVQEYGCCEVSLNLLDYKTTSLHRAYEGVSNLALEHGTCVKGSEIIGLVPEQALLDVAAYASKKDLSLSKSNRSKEEQLSTAIKFLNLNCIKPFIAQEKVLEYRLEKFGIYTS